MTAVATKRWWENRYAAAVVVLAMSMPLLWPSIPPFLDLPGHMGRYTVALAGDHAPNASPFYGYHWALLGNLGVDLLVLPLSHVIGVEAATKSIVLLIPVGMAAGFLWTAYEVHGRIPPTSLLALVFVYAYPLHYGFVNYVLGMALVALAFALWIRLARQRSYRNALLFAAIAAVVWVAHAIAWVALCTLCGSFELHRRLASGEAAGRAIKGTLWTMLPFASGILLTVLAAGGPPGTISGTFDGRAMAKAVLSLNRDRWLTVDFVTSAVLLLVVGLAGLRRTGLAIAPALAWPALGLLVLFLVIPDSVNDSAYIKTRILPWAVAYALLAIRTTRKDRRASWLWLCASMLGLRMIATTTSLYLYDRSFHAALGALDRIPARSRLATFSVNACHPTITGWTNNRRQHLGGIAVVRRGAFVNDQFESGALQLLNVRYAAAGAFRHSPSEVVSLQDCHGYPPLFSATLDRVPRQAFDFVWLLDVPRTAWPRRPWLRPVYSDGETILYAIKPIVGGKAVGGSQ